MARIVPTKLAELKSDTHNALVTALILTKSEPHFFLSKTSTDYHGVITFTLRDSKHHIVNCKYWGTKEKVDDYNQKFKIWDIIDIICPKVITQIANENFDIVSTLHSNRFQPVATLPLTLVLNENESFIEKHCYNNISGKELRKLIQIPHKPLSSELKLADVQCSINTDHNQSQFVDLLVAVGTLRPVKKLKSSRTGQLLQCLEVVVFDESAISGILLVIWHLDWIQHALQFWQSRKTILHLIDIKVTYSSFYKSTTLNFTPRTVIYENPEDINTNKLLQFAENLPIEMFDTLGQLTSISLPDPNNITNQMTVKQIYTRAEGNLKDQSVEFTAVLYGLVTNFDIDGLNPVISKKCKSCHRILPNKTNLDCDSNQCHLAFPSNFLDEKYINYFNIPMHLSDHTGTLVEARLNGLVAENVLGIQVDKFLQLKDEQLEELKWKYLMSYVEVKLLVKKCTAIRKNLAVVIVDLKKVTLENISEKIVVF